MSMPEFAELSTATARTFVLGGPVSFMSILALAVLQLTMVAIIFLIFYYYWFVVAITKAQGIAGGANNNQGRSLRQGARSIFGLDEMATLGESWRSQNGSNQDEGVKLAARIDEAIQRGILLNTK